MMASDLRIYWTGSPHDVRRFFKMTEPTKTAATPDPDTASVNASKKRLTPREYARVKTMWQSGEYSLSEIASEVGVSGTNLSRRFKRDGIEKGSNARKVAAAVRQQIERTSAAQAEELSNTAHDMKMMALKAIDLFNKKAYSDVAKAIHDKTPLGERLSDLKALETASKIISQNYATGARILGLDQELNADEQMPELQIHLMTENDVEALREQQRMEAAEANGEDIDDELMAGLTDEELDDLDVIIEGSGESEPEV